MRFIDSNVFIHAYIKPKRSLEEHEVRVKEEAKAIISSVKEGEEVVTTVVHIGEIANLLEDLMPFQTALEVVRNILLKGNIHVASVGHDDYLSALTTAEEHRIGINDALAYAFMVQNGIERIYSFDKAFDKLKKITRLTSSSNMNK